MIHVFRLLARFKLLRGTAFDLSDPAMLETPSRVIGRPLEQMTAVQ